MRRDVVAGYEAIAASVDREDAERATRTVTPSTSTTPRRCGNCGHWNYGNAEGRCTACSAPYVARELVGLPAVR